MLVRGGADLRARQPETGLTLTEMLTSIQQTKVVKDIIKLLTPGVALASSCATCGTVACSMKCVCRSVFYCSRSCQEKDWTRHKKSCTRPTRPSSSSSSSGASSGPSSDAAGEAVAVPSTTGLVFVATCLSLLRDSQASVLASFHSFLYFR